MNIESRSHMRRIDPVSAAIRIAADLDPSLGARLHGLRLRRRGDLSFRILRALVKPGDIVLDIGASTGIYTFELARLVGPSGHVHAIEPDPPSVARLEKMRKARPNITVHPVGLSDRKGVATLHVPVVRGRRKPTLASLAVPAWRSGVDHMTVTVDLKPLDSVLPADGRSVSFVKIDVEGHEFAVLRGGTATLRALPSMLVEIEQRHQETDIRSTFDLLRKLGYVGYAIGPQSLIPLEEFDVTRDQLAFVTSEEAQCEAMPSGYTNDFLFVRPGTDVLGFLVSA
jgi:FkbM family methyltransferase